MLHTLVSVDSNLVACQQRFKNKRAESNSVCSLLFICNSIFILCGRGVCVFELCHNGLSYCCIGFEAFEDCKSRTEL